MRARTNALFVCVALVAGAKVADAQVPSIATVPSKCEQSLYTGFDSRLKLEILGRLPDPKANVVGFEVVNHWPLVALPHELLGFTKNSVAEFPVGDIVKSIAVNKQSELRVQTTNTVLRLGDDGFKSDSSLATAIQGRLYNSGNIVYLEARSRKDLIQFLARKQNGTPFMIATIRGALRATSWNDSGLAAVVGNSLFVWEAGSKSVVRLLTDEGLAATHDISMVDARRVVVSLKSSVILVTPETMVVLVGMNIARCRFDSGILYLLDGGTGVIWALQGLSQLGTKTGDRDYAQELIQKAPKTAVENSPQFLEAARILGCAAAQKLLADASHRSQ